MIKRVEVSSKPEFPDVHGNEVLANIKQLGITSATAVSSIRVFLIESELDDAGLERIAVELLTDPVTEQFYAGNSQSQSASIVEVHLKPGVTDPVASSTQTAIADMGLKVDSVRTGRKYFISGQLSDSEIKTIAQRILANDCIEEVIFNNSQEPPCPHVEPYKLKLITVPLRKLTGEQLVELSKSSDLFLDEREMQTIQEYYKSIDRDPTDIELEMIAQTWSEHCVHKTFRGTIELTRVDSTGKVLDKEIIDNMMKTYLAKATRDLDKPWCISVFVDNSGVIEFDEDYGVCFKVETHNHPSAIEPYGGAATGIGGCIRDPMGTGKGAKPIANTDVFCFAEPDMALADLPSGVLHPRRVMKGVVGGVRDYGNRMGIPTVNGAIHFDKRYLGNPLVFCGNIGLIPNDKCFGKAEPGDLVVVVGGRTGRDGIHGATFSSGEMTHEHEDLFSHAVQIGNAITEKKVLDTLLQVRDEELCTAVTDCGAGGLSSAVGEMGEELGVIVDMENIPLKYAGLSYTEIWISEAQERMVLAVPPKNIERVLEIFESENVEAVVIGTFGNAGKLQLRYENTVVGELDMKFLHEGLPKFTRIATWQEPSHTEPELAEKANYNSELNAMFSDYNVASKEWVIRQYDHEVQGGSAIKPLVGAENDGPGDASVIRPLLGKDKGVALGCGICPQYSDIDPYYMALAAIDEAVRNVVSVGGRPDRIALLDNFCWGNCNKPDRLGGLVLANKGCYAGAMAYGAPFISGKDSLNNEFQTETGETINIPGTLLISAMTLVDDVNSCVTMDLKKAGNKLLVVGETRNELGAGLLYKLNGQIGYNVPKVDLAAGPANAKSVAAAISKGLVRSCHDCSEGGLAVALSEMAFAGNMGIDIELANAPKSTDVDKNYKLLFSETPSRYVLEVEPGKLAQLQEVLKGVTFAEIGTVIDSGSVVIKGIGGSEVLNVAGSELKASWQKPLAW